MPRALIGLLLLLQATPARYTLDAIAWRARQVRPSQQVEVGLSLNGRPAGQGTLLLDGGEAHFAFKDAFGTRGAVLRVSGGMVGLETAQREWIAPDAVDGVRELLGQEAQLGGLVELLSGRAPAGRWRRDGVGAFVQGTGVWARVGAQGEMLEAGVGPVHLEMNALDAVLRFRGQELVLRWSDRRHRPIPTEAFHMARSGEVLLLGSY